VLQRDAELLGRVIDRHRAEGLRYVEYRAMYATDDPEGFLNFHRLHARVAAAASSSGFEARYIVSLPRWAALEGYALLQRLFDEDPALVRSIVGVDFCFVEEGYPPADLAPLFARLAQDRRARPDRALDVVYHVGETYFDKSLESAVRWCHQAAELGARRLGHAIALGLDPEAAVARRPGAHECESVGERRAQIEYDLEHAAGLAAHGVAVERRALEREREELRQEPPQAAVRRPYDPERLTEVRRRQEYVLEELVRLGTAIECCPTSNLRLGGIPGPAAHPVHRFLASGVDLAIGADDPGLFESPLSAEVDWVAAHAGLRPPALALRLGDPHRLRLGQRRPG
jgi:adenosine deaminase